MGISSLLKAKSLMPSIGTVGSIGMNAGIAASEYINQRNEGSGVVKSALFAGVDLAMGAILSPQVYLGVQAMAAAPSIAVDTALGLGKIARSNSKFMNNANRPFNNAMFMDNKQIATMRQAGMALAEQSKYNIQQALLGNEAKNMHQ